MANMICWICEINRALKDYKNKELLGDDGDKPCLECILEFEAAREKEKEEENELR